jgi:hypothetical protein
MVDDAWQRADRIMVQKLPIGIQTFSTIRQENYLYVDKTEAIYRLLTSGIYFFLSRPRRFGKSLTLSTIKAIFAGERALFKGLWIEERWDWTKIHPVLHFSFSSIGYKSLGLEAAIEAELRVIGAQMGVQLEESGIARIFRELIQKLATTTKVVILIDEYDKPLIDYLEDKAQAHAHQQILKSFYSVIKDSDPYIEFLLLTGVSKFSKVSIFSDLNNLKDITLHREFATLTGYTQAEVEHYFTDTIARLAAEKAQSHADLLAEIRTWYNGYSWDGVTTLYNPFSFMSFIDGGEFRNFWFETGTPTFLLKLMQENRLFQIDDLEVNELAFASYDIEKLQLLPILFQAGYLTIKSKEDFGLYRIGYPNREVEASMLMYLIGELGHDEPALTTPMVVHLYRAFRANDLAQVIKLIKSIFKNIPSQIFIRDAEAYYHSLIYLVFFYLGQYTQSEVSTNDGRLDCVVQTATHIYILEFKLDASAAAALKQIKDRSYHEKYTTDPRPKVLVGINFSSEKKTVDDWTVETVK